jgi:hypothetical protein
VVSQLASRRHKVQAGREIICASPPLRQMTRTRRAFGGGCAHARRRTKRDVARISDERRRGAARHPRRAHVSAPLGNASRVVRLIGYARHSIAPSNVLVTLGRRSRDARLRRPSAARSVKRCANAFEAPVHLARSTRKQLLPAQRSQARDAMISKVAGFPHSCGSRN